MKKFINKPDELVEDMLEGFLCANRRDFVRIPGLMAYRKRHIRDKVGIMSNGGAGCEPMHIGYVGDGMGDATCIGEVFAAPSAFSIYETAKAIHTGKGILLICGNFAGDYLNSDMALELLSLEGIEAELILVRDDILSASKQNRNERGGIAGIIYVLKTAGAASEAGCALQEVARLARKAAENVFSMSVALYSGYNPQNGVKMFDMPDEYFELGMGFNGEPGVERLPMTSASEIVDRMLFWLDNETTLCEGTEICMMINSMGATGYMELLILCKELCERFRRRNVKIYDIKVNRYLTSQEMGGCSVSIMKLDEELKNYYDHEAYTPVFAHRRINEGAHGTENFG